MRKFQALVFLLAALCIASPAHAYFCWGEDKRDPRDLLRDADVVFSGKVVKLEDMGIDPAELKTRRTNVVFRLEKAWKGLSESTGRNVNVDTEAFYEYDFKQGESYLVYGYRIYNGRISMIGCPRIQTTATSEKAMRLLGSPVVNYAGVPDAAAPEPEAKQPAANAAPAAAPAPAPQMDQQSVDTLLHVLEEEKPAAEAAAQAPVPDAVPVTNVPASPIEPAAPATPEATPPVAPAAAALEAEKKPEEQLDVIWGKPAPEQPPVLAPKPEIKTQPTEQLDVIWEDAKPEAAPALPPPPPAPNGGTP